MGRRTTDGHWRMRRYDPTSLLDWSQPPVRPATGATAGTDRHDGLKARWTELGRSEVLLWS